MTPRLPPAGRRWPREMGLTVAAREIGLAALPAVLTVVLLALATQPAYRALSHSGTGWSPYAYQGLSQDVQAYQVAVLTPGLSDAERREVRDQALSSARNPAQFSQLREIEGYGEARLSLIERYLQQDTPVAAAQAAREAVSLNAQAGQHAIVMAGHYVDALRQLRLTLIGTAVVTGLLSALLAFRVLLMWRGELERRARREARQREALSLASHELRRPLQSLLLASDLLRHADTPQQRTRLLGLIEDSAAQLASRADLSRLNDLYLDVTLRPRSQDLRPLLERFAAARVELSLPPQPLVWPVDGDRVRQIAENLIENALKYTAGPVEVALRQVSGQPEITVRDHGPGLSDELCQQAFLPYDQGPRGLRGGHGLGLPLVRRYARAHGGDVTLASAPGGGLQATVRLGQPTAALSEMGALSETGTRRGPAVS